MKSKSFWFGLVLIIGIAVLVFGGQSATAQADETPLTPLVNQMIIKYKAEANLNAADQAQAANQMQRLSLAAGMELTYFRPMSGEAHVLRLPEPLSEADADKVAARLKALPEVEYAEPDYIMFPMGETGNTPLAVPDDSLYGSQWHYSAPIAGSYGINAPAAWDITTGSASIYVAVLDTGITNHADLSGRWQGGYDMISDSWSANDGGGRDSDPHDPGDWVAANDCYAGSSAGDSSWHGTHVAGTIGAATNNSTGVAGINWVSKVIPVRVLGKCGGTTSDIADGIRWAAGLSVVGVPANPYPAKVINMSLGGYRTNGCLDTPTYQSAINDAYAAGSSVIVAAGNSDDDASKYVPASCNNVVTVAATDRNGGRAYYSNYGSVVEISGPGGAQSSYNDSNGVLSTLNTGTTVPASDTYIYYQGTSMAAPHVSGIASLLYSVNPSLTPAQVLSAMQNTVTAFPGGSSCNTSICGSGIVNAGAAVASVSNVPPAAPVISSISNADGDGSYTVDWNDVATATGYTLQEDDNSGFTSPSTIYTGAASQYAVTGRADGTWYYRVRGSNTYGDGNWSNTVSVYVGALRNVYLPLAINNYSAPGSGWTTITSLDFEGAFPGGWSVSDQSSYDGGQYYWGKRNCQVATGSYSGWAVGGGANGGVLSCGSNYPNYVESWMVYGPFDLSSAQAAELIFKRWLNSEQWPDLSYGDWLCALRSTNGTNFSGSCSSGNSAGWEDYVLDLVTVTGQPQVWVAFYFTSDLSTSYPGGAFVDDVILRKCDSNCTTFSIQQHNNPGSDMITVDTERPITR